MSDGDSRRRLLELEVLLEMGVELASTLDLSRVLSLALQKAEELCHAESSSIWELDDENSRLAPDNFFTGIRGPKAAYGWGLSANLLGLELNWDFGKRWDGKETLTSGFETSFWIGSRF